MLLQTWFIDNNNHCHYHHQSVHLLCVFILQHWCHAVLNQQHTITPLQTYIQYLYRIYIDESCTVGPHGVHKGGKGTFCQIRTSFVVHLRWLTWKWAFGGHCATCSCSHWSPLSLLSSCMKIKQQTWCHHSELVCFAVKLLHYWIISYILKLMEDTALWNAKLF